MLRSDMPAAGPFRRMGVLARHLGNSSVLLGVLARHLGNSSVCLEDGCLAPTTTSSTCSASSSAVVSEGQLCKYDRDGYVVISDLVSDELVERLLAATNSVTDLARSLGPNDVSSPLCHSIRTAYGVAGDGVDFTRHNPNGFLHTQGEPWSISGVLSPDLPESAVFLEYYGSEQVVAAAQAFLGQELQLGDISPFVNPQEADFSIGWHRDMNWYSNGVDPDFSDAAERAVWERRSYNTDEIGEGRMTENDDRRINASNRSPKGRGRIKWHLALLPDSSFEIVPGSHLRWRTEQERAVLGHYNGESLQPDVELTKHSPLDEGIVVHAVPGDCIFWNGDCIHRGANQANVERRTLACNYDAWDERQTVEAVAQRGGTLNQQGNWRWRCEERVGESMPSEFLKQAWERWRLCQPHANLEWGLS